MSRVAMLAIVLILGGGSAVAQNAPGMTHPQPMPGMHQPMAAGPCATDRAKYCKNVQPGGGRIVDCLAGHQAQLAPACKERMEPVFKKRGQYRA